MPAISRAEAPPSIAADPTPRVLFDGLIPSDSAWIGRQASWVFPQLFNAANWQRQSGLIETGLLAGRPTNLVDVQNLYLTAARDAIQQATLVPAYGVQGDTYQSVYKNITSLAGLFGP